MSALIPQNTLAELYEPDFFASDQGHPITPVFMVKIGTLPEAGSYGVDVIVTSSPDETNAHIAGFASSSGQGRIVAEALAGTSVSAIAYPGDALQNRWQPGVCVLQSSTNRTVYTLDTNDETITGNNTFSRAPAGVRDLRLMRQAWAHSDVRIAYIAIYQAALTQAQAEEYFATGAVAALTPYALYPITTDWASTGGQILDVSGNGRHLTPPAEWVYSADNPAVQTDTASVPAITVQDPENNGAAIQASDWTLWVTRNSDDAVILPETTGVASDASGVIAARNVEAGASGEVVWVHGRSKTAQKGFDIRTTLGAVI